MAGRDTLNKLDTLLLNKPAPPQPPKPAFDRKVRLHFRSAAMPVVPEFTALDNAQKVYSQINVKLEFVSGLSIGITDEDQLRLDASDGTCHWNQASDEMKLLESLGGRGRGRPDRRRGPLRQPDQAERRQHAQRLRRPRARPADCGGRRVRLPLDPRA